MTHVDRLMKLTRMKQELDDFLSFTSDSPDTLVREDVMIVSSSQCLVRPYSPVPAVASLHAHFYRSPRLRLHRDVKTVHADVVYMATTNYFF